MFGVAHGCWWHLRLQWGSRSLVGPVAVGVARGPWADPRQLASPSALQSAVLACSCPEHSLQRSLNCAFRSALPDCSVLPGTAAVLKLVTSAFTQTLPSQLSTFAVGTRPLPTCRPRPPFLVKVHFCKYVHIK